MPVLPATNRDGQDYSNMVVDASSPCFRFVQFFEIYFKAILLGCINII